MASSSVRSLVSKDNIAARVYHDLAMLTKLETRIAEILEIIGKYFGTYKQSFVVSGHSVRQNIGRSPCPMRTVHVRFAICFVGRNAYNVIWYIKNHIATHVYLL